MAGLLDPTVHGRKTPVPPRDTLLGLTTIGRKGANITTGVRMAPHSGIMSIASKPACSPFAVGCGVGTPGCHTVMALVGDAVGIKVLSSSMRTLKNVMLTLLFGDEHITCLATSALFALMTTKDLLDLNK